MCALVVYVFVALMYGQTKYDTLLGPCARLNRFEWLLRFEFTGAFPLLSIALPLNDQTHSLL